MRTSRSSHSVDVVGLGWVEESDMVNGTPVERMHGRLAVRSGALVLAPRLGGFGPE